MQGKQIIWFLCPFSPSALYGALAAGPLDFSHLFVTSSFDWTVKLWSTKNNKPLYSFEDNSDYVYDVMWSPTHPALFACVDGVGHLDLWNLNNDTEVLQCYSTLILSNIIHGGARSPTGSPHSAATRNDTGKHSCRRL
ncbi:Cytoplasmic dynein 1 intermediate chain 2 [Liparis tanakae]|uniref:Cytoplasmic dynein 1 intermediate chain 2 n=1 Tax=Liparis tanakae TaxID=230148 RepID=A0A4Z2EJ91_9TELE|nr:Cytoplasmic dynein 1 intermediate chain 2 [Liparis tanakae]